MNKTGFRHLETIFHDGVQTHSSKGVKMKIPKDSRWLAEIEKQVFENITSAIAGGKNKKREILEKAAHDAFIEHFPKDGSVTSEGGWLIRHIFAGGFAAAEEENWPIEKTAKQLSRGLLSAVNECDKDFEAGAVIVVRAAIQCALLTNADIDKITEKVMKVVLNAGKEKGCNLQTLTKTVSRAAAKASKSFPRQDVSSMEKLLMDFLEGKGSIDDERVSWNH